MNYDSKPEILANRDKCFIIINNCLTYLERHFSNDNDILRFVELSRKMMRIFGFKFQRLNIKSNVLSFSEFKKKRDEELLGVFDV